MSKRMIFIFISIFYFSCNFVEDKSKGIIVNGDIPEEIFNRLIELKLINQSDKVIALEYDISNESNFFAENYILFTRHKLIRYFESSGMEARIFEAPFCKTLNITNEMDSVLDRTEINTIILDTILFSKSQQRDFIHYNHNNFFGLSGSQFIKQKEFCQLLMETWKNNVEYLSLREIYDKHFDENGEIKATHDEIFERKKLQLLKDRIEELSIDVLDKEDYLVMNHDNSLFLIRYFFNRKEFEVVKLVVYPTPSDEAEVENIIFTYVTQRHEKRAFPFTEQGITYKEAQLSIEHSEKNIIDKYIK